MNQWRRFEFFEKEEVMAQDSDEVKSISCGASGRGVLVLGYVSGTINVVDRDQEVIHKFVAFDGVGGHLVAMKMAPQKDILVTLLTLGDGAQYSPVLKFWDFNRFEGGTPALIRVIKLPHDTTATALSVNDSLSQLAVGTADGWVFTITGNPLKERFSIVQKARVASNDPVTDLFFTEEEGVEYLFVVMSSSVASYYSNTEKFALAELLDDKGADSGCSVLGKGGELVIADNMGIYFYYPRRRGPARGYEGDRKMISWYKNYLVVVDQASSNFKYNTLTIYDVTNKFKAYYFGSFEHVSFILAEWDQLFIMTQNGKLFRLIEKDTSTKLETLFKKNLYQVAIDMAYSTDYDPAAIMNIYREFGDHLYDTKSDFDGAMTQYIKTIGKKGNTTVEPSSIIRRFLEPQQIHNLSAYLEALHEAEVANPHHTTLLLNCYTKAKDVSKLSEFIKQPDLNFDVETAIKVCLQANYHEIALVLARTHRAHHWYVKILLEDLNRGMEALSYIGRLPFSEAEDAMRRHGKALLSLLPKLTTQFLKKLCTNYVPVEEVGVPSSHHQAASPDQFVDIYVDNLEWLVEFLEFVMKNGSATAVVYNTLLDLYLRDDEEETESDKIKEIKRNKALKLLESSDAEFDEGQALVLCRMRKFKPGQLELFKRMKLYNELIQYYMENSEYGHVIKTCKDHANKDPDLWVNVLAYFSTRKDAQEEIVEILREVEVRHILPPMQVLQVLARSPTAKLKIVKDYIIKYIQREQNLISQDQQRSRDHDLDAKRNAAEIKELTTQPKRFQHKNCSRCHQTLDLPVFHFLCNHSYHQRCLGENESVCPKCADGHAEFKTRQQLLDENSRKHSEFFKMLRGSRDNKFGVVAEYFGRRLFNQESTVTSELPNLDPDLFKDLGLGI